MKNIWNKWLKDVLFIYCGLYTVATIVSSIRYLSLGIFEDPSGNWHELDRAVVTFIIGDITKEGTSNEAPSNISIV